MCVDHAYFHSRNEIGHDLCNFCNCCFIQRLPANELNYQMALDGERLKYSNLYLVSTTDSWNFRAKRSYEVKEYQKLSTKLIGTIPQNDAPSIGKSLRATALSSSIALGNHYIYI